MKVRETAAVTGVIAVGVLACTAIFNPSGDGQFRHALVTVAATTAALAALATHAPC